MEAADEATATRAFDIYKATQPETLPDDVAERLLSVCWVASIR
ncbi:hypothetical protein [Azospirillum argentinense]|nr:hypothetical protein [Azospirillum argentinense]